MTSKKVSALFVDGSGPYSTMDNVEPWDINADARLYQGPYPVVAHPPCNRWGKMAPINLKRWGTPIGEDGGCFESALQSVRKWGGVLEHPCGSIAWSKYNLKKPKGDSWNQVSDTEWVGEVWQSDYGHLATKKTWLLFVGTNKPKNFLSNRVKGTHQVGGGIHTGNNKKPRLNQSVTHLTPILFAEYLVELAASSKINE